jgi:hypothetical protein
VLGPDRYLKGTTFIAADQDGFSAILAEAVAEHRPGREGLEPSTDGL